MPLKGADKHIIRLKKLQGPEIVKFVGAALFEGGELIQTHAQKLITMGSVSGKHHKPSAPGRPPSNDTGVLKNNIETTHPEPLRVLIGSYAPYAAIHEFGGAIQHPGGTPYFMRDGKPVFVSNRGQGAFHGLPKTKPHTIILPARPYMIPARNATRKEVVKLVVKAMNFAVKRSKA